MAHCCCYHDSKTPTMLLWASRHALAGAARGRRRTGLAPHGPGAARGRRRTGLAPHGPGAARGLAQSRLAGASLAHCCCYHDSRTPTMLLWASRHALAGAARGRRRTGLAPHGPGAARAWPRTGPAPHGPGAARAWRRTGLAPHGPGAARAWRRTGLAPHGGWHSPGWQAHRWRIAAAITTAKRQRCCCGPAGTRWLDAARA
jgi:hypothetical protein